MTKKWRLHHGPGTEWWRPDLSVENDGRPAVSAAVPPAAASAVPFWALMGFSIVAFLAPQEHFPVLAPLRLALLTASVAVLTYLFDRFIHQRPITVLTSEIWVTAGLVGWAIFTVPLSYWPGRSFSFLVDLYLKSVVIFWLLSNTVNTLPRLRQVAWGLSLMTAPMAATAVGNFVSGYFITAVAYPVRRIAGYDAPLTANANDLALMLNLLLPFSVALLLVTRRLLLRAVLVLIIGLDVVAVILTFSRGGFLTLATILVMYLWKFRSRPERAWIWAALLLAAACVPLLPSEYIERVSTITRIEADETGSAQVRWNDTVAAVRFFLANPIIGAGIGMNFWALNHERGFGGVTHNAYLEYAVELGIPGLILFLLLLVGCIKAAGVAQRRSAEAMASRDLFYLAEGIQISLLAFSVGALFLAVGYLLYFYYVAGLAVAVKTISTGRDRDTALHLDQVKRSSPGSATAYAPSAVAR